MQAAAVALAIVLTLICVWWTLGYVWRRARTRHR
jgi:hypothetical protein